MGNDLVENMFGIDNTITAESNTVEVDVNAKSDKAEIDGDKDTLEDNPEIEKYKQQIEKLTKQKSDSEKWGNEHREMYVNAKKKTDELAKRLLEEGTIFEEEYAELSKVFDKTLDNGSVTSEEVVNTPIAKVLADLKTTFEGYKKWSTESDLDFKYQSFFKDLELVTDKRLAEIQEYLLNETDPKVLLKYVLDKGTRSYDKFYKKIVEKGDAVSYVEELESKNEKLEKELKELRLELDDTEEKSYNKSTSSTNRYIKKNLVGDLFG
jgi:predicted  nucleic acid-binding Zn-ribbon protein